MMVDSYVGTVADLRRILAAQISAARAWKR